MFAYFIKYLFNSIILPIHDLKKEYNSFLDSEWSEWFYNGVNFLFFILDTLVDQLNFVKKLHLATL